MRRREEEIRSYFNYLKEKFYEIYEIASRARAKGIDPEPFVEIKPARDLAERIEKLIGIKGVAKRIRELEKEMDRVLVAFKIAEEVIDGELGELKGLDKRIEMAIRTGLAILTDGITAAPLQGIDSVRIKQNDDGSNYLAIYYAGPIRSAGGTEQALSVLLGDWVRQRAGLEKYKPTKAEIERYVEEIRIYERYVTRFQYHASDEEIRFVVSRIPIEITGVATDPVEVSIHRDLPRVETNCVRGGALRVINDGIIAKARKLKKIIDELEIKGWSWIDELIKLRTNDESNSSNSNEKIVAEDKYLADLVAGRPVFSHPSRKEGFRIRYGRSRNTGLAAIGMNPATMIILDEFLAIGTQVRIERPGKSAIVMPVTTIEGPIVKLKDGSVLQVNDVETANKVKDLVSEVIFTGDILVAYGEFKENNYPLVPSGYCEEWWAEELRGALRKKLVWNLIPYLDPEIRGIMKIIEDPLHNKPDAVLALRISEKYGVPLHPKFTYLWDFVTLSDVILLREELMKGKIEIDDKGIVKRILCKLTKRAKRALELLGIPHRVIGDHVVIEEHAPIVYRLFALNKGHIDVKSIRVKSVKEFFEKISGLKLRDKITIGTGMRMGRPEKAAPRKMKPPVNALFPIGEYGGRMRNLNDVMKYKAVVLDLNIRKCSKCGRRTFDYRCSVCGSRTIKIRICPKCGRETFNNVCPVCQSPTVSHIHQRVNLSAYIKELARKYNVIVPKQVKCVKGLINDDKEPEPLVKGILRAKYDLMVFKDGTIRYDATNAPLTHFKPKEIGVSVEKLVELGYKYDYKGRPLRSEEQLVELKVQDIIIPRKCGEYLLKVSKFIDELLVKVYGMEPYYKAERVEDLIGHLVIGLAPHTSAGVLGRIIGFTDANVIYAHPYWHAAKRRNCDGDEDSVMLALDALLNFSRHYLPSKRGGVMDSPLVLTLIVDPREVDDEVHNMDVVDKYPLEFYVRTQDEVPPSELRDFIEIVEDRLGRGNVYYDIRFTHDTEDINIGPKDTSYRLLKTMREKIDAQLRVAKKIRAVDEDDVAERLLTKHLLPDLAGNLRAFSLQGIRCTKCNTVFRRAPLRPKCPLCGGNLVLTIHQKSVMKYLKFIIEIAEKYRVNDYIRERVNVLSEILKFLFHEGVKETLVLDDYMKVMENAYKGVSGDDEEDIF